LNSILFWITEGYTIIPFVPGYENIAGKRQQLLRISVRHLISLDALLREYFNECSLKHVEGIRTSEMAVEIVKMIAITCE